MDLKSRTVESERKNYEQLYEQYVPDSLEYIISGVLGVQ